MIEFTIGLILLSIIVTLVLKNAESHKRQNDKIYKESKLKQNIQYSDDDH